MMRKDNTINRLGQKKAELKILNLQEIPSPDLPHHKKREIFPKSQIRDPRMEKKLLGLGWNDS